jgi:biotin synthase
MQKKIWQENEVTELFELPFLELIFQALSIHKLNFNLDELELCSLLSVKTGGCPEDCAYCPQSAHYKTSVKKESMTSLEEVIIHAKQAKQAGAKRLCIGAAWRNPNKNDLPKILEMIKSIKSEGLESCATLGMINEDQARELYEAGLDFYNHNLDTSPEYYKEIITTRTYQNRIDTLDNISRAGINVCSGGIIGMGEQRIDRVRLLVQLANLATIPKSVPINKLIPIEGTPLADSSHIDNIEFVRTIAIARIMMPKSMVRLSAGRSDMSQELQTLCFLAGANSIWLGEKLLTAANSEPDKDIELMDKLGLKPMISA